VEGTSFGSFLTVGGCSIAFCGTAAPPHPMLKERYRIDLAAYVAEATDELRLAPLPERLIGEGAKRIRRAARAEGLDWRPFSKFIDPDKCDLSMKCYAGCPSGAKWSARDYIEEVIAGGGRLRTHMRVEQVLVDGGRATGVRGTGRSGPFEVEAETVVLAANGLGTAMILQASGFPTAGQGVFVDPLITTYGTYAGPGSTHDIPMSCGTFDLLDEDIFMCDAWDPWPFLYLGLLTAGREHLSGNLGRMRRYPHCLGIMTKIKDRLNGSVGPDGQVSKPIEEEEKRLFAHGSEIATRILTRAGCDPSSIFSTPPMGSNPSGTVRIGNLVDTDLRTEVPGLYVCDTSVLPEPDGLPPVLTIIALGKRLVAEQLANGRRAEVASVA
jgi:choline dehydrogenase-like flavoprotein